MSTPTINRGITPGGRTDAVRLYWEAFSRKLAPALEDPRRAVEVLARRPCPGELLLDGVCVVRPARRTGIGTRLLNEAITLAHAESATSVRLSVFCRATQMVRPADLGTTPRGTSG